MIFTYIFKKGSLALLWYRISGFVKLLIYSSYLSNFGALIRVIRGLEP